MENEAIMPFRLLGRSKEKLYHFLAEDTGVVISLQPQQMTKKNFFDLAPRQFWVENYPVMVWDKENQVHIPLDKIDEEKASDDLIQRSKKIKYSIGKYRSGGFWNDEGRIVYNPGHGYLYELKKNKAGKSTFDKINYTDFESEYYYMVSERSFPLPPPPEKDKFAKKIDGQKLEKLFKAQSFKTEFEAKYLMGWSLLAPFGTILKWRPHVWISGQKERGKSWLFENIIGPLGCGSEFVTGSGSSFAALRRNLGENGGYAIIDEMDGRNKSIRERIDEIMELVKNASTDTSGISYLVINGRTETFCVNQMFCLVAIIPQMEGQALKSRVFNVEINNQVTMPEKIKATNEVLKDGFFDEKSKFFNRTFYYLGEILESSKVIHEEIKKVTFEVRKADVVAPCLAAYWHSMHSEIIPINEAKKLTLEYMKYLGRQEKEEQDYDTFFRILFGGSIKIIDNNNRSVDQVIGKILTTDNVNYAGNLENIGLKINGKLYLKSDGDVDAQGELYISTKSGYIMDLMGRNETYFHKEYGRVLKDHPAYTRSKSERVVNTTYCHVFDLSKIADMYFRVKPETNINVKKVNDENTDIENTDIEPDLDISDTEISDDELKGFINNDDEELPF
jgi:hypothetical protein